MSLDHTWTQVIDIHAKDVHSIVYKEGADNHDAYPIEFLDTFTSSGLPFSKLDLKIGCSIMLLHNLAHK
jgi:hypothetical protein